MEDEVFKLVNKHGNDQFSKMDKSSLNNLIKKLNNYYLDLRYNLKIPDITFGIEIEVEHTHTRRIKHKIIKNNLNDWIVTGDASLEKGCEIVSPILTNKNSCYQDIKTACEIISKRGIVGKNSGGHIHIGSQILGNNKDNWINLAGIWSAYENIFYRFLYGEYLTPRTSIQKYAKPIATSLCQRYSVVSECEKKGNNTRKVISIIRITRDSAINFSNVYEKTSEYNPNTSNIEFRCPNSTLDPTIWQNNVNLIAHILEYASSNNVNRDLIDKRTREINKTNIEDYNKIDLDKALEVCDLIFTDNLDKIYFLRQYLKSLETSNEPLVKAKKITK